MTNLSQVLDTISECYDIEFEPLTIDDRTFEVLAIRNMRQHLDRLLSQNAIKNPLHDLPLWAKVWPGSFVLGRLLRKYEPRGKSLLELGAGMGIMSLTASSYDFSEIVLTDVNEDALLFARANVLKNGLAERITVRSLDLGLPSTAHSNFPAFDLIAASELLYLKELHRPILKFLQSHLKPSGTALFLTDHARRQPQFSKLASRYFSFREGHVGIKSKNEQGEEARRLFSVTILSHKI